MEPSLPREPAHVRYARHAAKLHQEQGSEPEVPAGAKRITLTPKVQKYLLALLDGRTEPEADALRLLLNANNESPTDGESIFMFPHGANRR
ncbi:hypothetical protein [Streptomyces sp. NPDC005336]|uniref:hypothetical protein n=1 Tax=unclassified Streptomyces TaxID=2593676 RepID=UPI0033B424AA